MTFVKERDMSAEKEPVVESAEKPKRVVKPAKSDKVFVISKYDRFVDLVNNVEIGQTPVEVEMHPWLEAQVSVGLLIVVK